MWGSWLETVAKNRSLEHQAWGDWLQTMACTASLPNFGSAGYLCITTGSRCSSIFQAKERRRGSRLINSTGLVRLKAPTLHLRFKIGGWKITYLPTHNSHTRSHRKPSKPREQPTHPDIEWGQPRKKSLTSLNPHLLAEPSPRHLGPSVRHHDRVFHDSRLHLLRFHPSLVQCRPLPTKSLQPRSERR